MQMVFDAGDLTSAEKSVLLAYCNFTDAHGYCWPGVERIADMTGISVRTIKRTRAALTERGLLGSKRRLNSTGQSITSMTRVNLTMLADLKRPARNYDDNVIEEITFAAPEQARGHCDTPTKSEGAPVAPGGCHSGPWEGDTVAPNPSVDPSSDPSSSSVTVEDKAPVAAPSETKKKSSDREEAERIIGERLPGTTPDERSAIVDVILAEAAAKGRKIGFLATYTRRRPDVLLEQDLAQVRRHSAAPTITHCGIHQAEMKPYGCEACAGEIKAGDRDQAVAHLALVGEKARPDLARLLGAPQKPVGVSYSQDPAAYLRGINNGHRSRVVGGSRMPVPDHNYWASLTPEQLKNIL